MKKWVWISGIIMVCWVSYDLKAPAREREAKWDTCFDYYFPKDPAANRFEVAWNQLPIEQLINFKDQLEAAEQHRVQFAKSYCGEKPS